MISFSHMIAQESQNVKKSIAAVRTENPPIIDGNLDDTCWKDASEAVDFTDALLGTPTEDETMAWISYDDHAIYVAFHAFDSQPNKIFARETKDQVRPRGEDRVSFTIDPFHTHQWDDRSFLIVNPLGAKYVYLATGHAEKTEWLGLWEAAAEQTNDGWTAEMEIPWLMLDYPNSEEPITIGINFFRFQQRTGARSWWSNIGTQEFYENAGHWEDVIPPQKERELKILPYTYLAGVESSGHTNTSARLGLDIRYGITPQLTLVGTLNPDFENVEQAVEGIDFSYGARFVPDRRPFFQEGRNVFGLGNFYHSRQISNMDAGLNLFGKISRYTSMGALATFHREGTHNLILRILQSLTETSSIGAAYLGHRDLSGTNGVLLLEGDTRSGELAALGRFAQSWNGSEISRYWLASIRYFGARFGAALTPFLYDPDFVNQLGYHPFTGIWGSDWSIYIRNEWRSGLFRSAGLTVWGGVSDNFDGSVDRRTLYMNPWFVTHSDYRVALRWVTGQFEQFHDNEITVSARGRVSDQFTNYGISYSWGQRAGHSIRFIRPSLSLRLGNFTTGLESQLLWHFQKRTQHILTLNYDFTPALSIGGRLISEQSSANIYFALRRSGYAGTDFFVIIGDPNAEKFQRRIVGKVVKAF